MMLALASFGKLSPNIVETGIDFPSEIVICAFEREALINLIMHILFNETALLSSNKCCFCYQCYLFR